MVLGCGWFVGRLLNSMPAIAGSGAAAASVTVNATAANGSQLSDKAKALSTCTNRLLDRAT